MGLTIKIKGADFSNFFTSLTLPSRAGLVAEYVFGGSAAASIRNRANLALPATVEPSTAATPVYPTYSPYSVECMAYETAVTAFGINTNLIAPADCTVIVIRALMNAYSKPFGSVKSTHIGAVGFSDAGGVSNFRNGSAGGAVDVVAGIANPAVIAGKFFFSAGIGRSTAAAINHTFIDGVRTTVTSGNVPISRTTDPFMVGGLTNSNGMRGASSTAYAAVYDRLLSDAEVDAAYAQLKAYYSGKIVIS